MAAQRRGIGVEWSRWPWGRLTPQVLSSRLVTRRIQAQFTHYRTSALKFLWFSAAAQPSIRPLCNRRLAGGHCCFHRDVHWRAAYLKHLRRSVMHQLERGASPRMHESDHLLVWYNYEPSLGPCYDIYRSVIKPASFIFWFSLVINSFLWPKESKEFRVWRPRFDYVSITAYTADKYCWQSVDRGGCSISKMDFLYLYYVII